MSELLDGVLRGGANGFGCPEALGASPPLEMEEEEELTLGTGSGGGKGRPRLDLDSEPSLSSIFSREREEVLIFLN